MKKETFLDILCRSTPESLNKFIEEKGKKKLINPLIMINKQTEEMNNE